MAQGEKDTLFNTIWKIADDLRGSVDGWDFKMYVLGFLFYKFLSENLSDYVNKMQQGGGDSNYDYTKESDENALLAKPQILAAKGFFIAPSELFCNVNLKDENLNITLSNIFANIENSTLNLPSNKNFKGILSDINLNDKKNLGSNVKDINNKLSKIITALKGLHLKYANNAIDAFGDAYEYLIKMYASNAGKSGGEFFTPQEVSTLLAKITLLHCPNPNKIYDPACGSASLLLSFGKILKQTPKFGYFGQEINAVSFNLARMNMILHSVNFTKFNIAHGDTLLEHKQKSDEPFDIIVSNPPYSIKWIGDDDITLINDERYAPAGVLAPKSKADFAFVLHILSALSNKGCAAVLCFPGIFYRSGAEAKIRKYLIEQNFIDCIIALPENLFFGTGITIHIMILRKNKIDNNVFFADVSAEFTKAKNKNQLSQENIENIFNIYKNKENLPHISATISQETIAANDYNLNVSSYVEAKDTREKIDINVLNNDIKNIVEKEQYLRQEIDKIVQDLGAM